MYGYSQSNENNLMTNLNSISSSLSSIDTIGQRPNSKASVDNLIAPRTHSVASTSLLWRGHKDDKYAPAPSIAGSRVTNASRYAGSEIYHTGGRSLKSCKFTSESALNLILIPLLLLTIARQALDFLGQIWLQVIINFLTVILIIVALFGLKQHRISYLAIFATWALFNTVWSVIIICIHTKLRDVGLGEEILSLYTGALSWWHSNGPGCLPYNISSFQPSISILQPNIITGCRLDYHLIEAAQAAIHGTLSFLATIFCGCNILNIRRSPSNFYRKPRQKSEKFYQMNNLSSARNRVNQHPFPNQSTRSLASGSLKRPVNRTGSRSSRHSVSSNRSATRRRHRQYIEAIPHQRGSTSSAHRSQNFGSLSSRRSNKKESRDIASLTYGTTSDRASTSRRTRLSSQSSTEYLPSYQPPHSSNANLLSSYGEISSIDSYNNPIGRKVRKPTQKSSETSVGKVGRSNPTYEGSRSSLNSFNVNASNYDDPTYIYGYGRRNVRDSDRSTYSKGVSDHPAYGQTSSNSVRRAGHRAREQQVIGPQRIEAEIYTVGSSRANGHVNGNETLVKGKIDTLSNGTSGFHSFGQKPHKQTEDANNNYMSSNYREFEKPNNFQVNGHQNMPTNAPTSTFQNQGSSTSASQQQIYANQRGLRHPIYSNQMSSGNTGETPM